MIRTLPVMNVVGDTDVGKAGSMSADIVSTSTTTASNTRSTTSEAKPAANGTGASRDKAYGLRISPTRPLGSVLFAMNPIAVARHNGPNGRLGAMGSRM